MNNQQLQFYTAAEASVASLALACFMIARRWLRFFFVGMLPTSLPAFCSAINFADLPCRKREQNILVKILKIPFYLKSI